MSETPTLIDTTPEASETDRGGWLTAEAYLAWVSGNEGILLTDRPFAQPPPFEVDVELEEEASIAA